jgi:hypothetical protein
MLAQLMRSRIALVSLLMSLVCVAITIEARLEWGPIYRPADEGWQAHMFQLLLVLQVPCLMTFAIFSLKSVKNGWLILGTLVALVAADVATVRLFNL